MQAHRTCEAILVLPGRPRARAGRTTAPFAGPRSPGSNRHVVPRDSPGSSTAGRRPPWSASLVRSPELTWASPDVGLTGCASHAVRDGGEGWPGGQVVADEAAAAVPPGQVAPGQVDQGGDPVAAADQGDQVQREPG